MNMWPYILLFLLATFSACGLLGGEGKEPLEPGPRNYEWRVDTLNNGPGVFYNIWGSSPEDVWAVSTGGLHAVWHFDGSKWEPFQKGNIPSTAEAVYGFSQDNVWMGGGSRIYYFNGNTWELFFEFEKQGLYASYVTDIWGDSPSNLYAIGTFYMAMEAKPQGFILQYDGKAWKELLVTDFDVQFQRIRIEKGTPLIRAVKSSPSGDETLLVYKYVKTKLREIIAYSKSEIQSLSINNIGKDTYYYTGNAISKFENNNTEEFLNFPGIDKIIRIDGRHKKDIFIHIQNKVLHYNGENLVPILEDLPRNVFRAQLFSEEVFFVIWDVNNGTTLVYHGTLTGN